MPSDRNEPSNGGGSPDPLPPPPSLPSAELPPGDCLLFERPGRQPDEREQYHLENPRAIVVFTQEDKAERFRKALLGPEWEMVVIDRADLLGWLAESVGIGI